MIVYLIGCILALVAMIAIVYFCWERITVGGIFGVIAATLCSWATIFVIVMMIIISVIISLDDMWDTEVWSRK